MPPAISYTPDDKDIRQAAEAELRQRRESIGKSWAYYRGEHQKHLKADKKSTDDNVTVNLCKQLVDRVVSFLVPRFPDLELDELKDTEQEKWLRTAWKVNGGPLTLAKVAMNGCMAGHCFVRVMPSKPGSKFPRIIDLNPANVLAFWRGDDKSQVLWYQIQWELGKKLYRQDIVDRSGAWEIIEYVGAADAMNSSIGWQTKGATEVWPYPLGPITDWQHGLEANAYYGPGELGHLSLNDKVNKVISDNSRILRFHASPRTIGTGMSAEEVTPTAIDNFWTIDNADAKVFNLEMKGDLAASMNMADSLTKAFYAEGRVVVLTGSIAEFQRVTNLGIRALYIDQLAKNEELGWQYGEGIQGVSQRVRMVNGEPDYDAPVTTKWADPLPKDPLEVAGKLQIERDMGIVSQHTASEQMDHNWQLEQEYMAEETDAQAATMEKLMIAGGGRGVQNQNADGQPQ
jgi:hypothetical protein